MPTLDEITFELPDPTTWEISCESDEEKNAALFWEILSKFLLLCLQKANNDWLQPKKLSGEPALVEYHAGTVTRVTGPIISVCYGEGDNAFESEYEISQFRRDRTINRGDQVEAVIGLWHQKHLPRGIDQLISREEQNELDAAWQSQKDVVVGDLEL